MDFQKFIAELQRRNVFRATIAYLAVAWLLVQIASIVFPIFFDDHDLILKILIYLLGLGLFFWIGFSWMYDLTPQGFKKSSTTSTDNASTKSSKKKLNKVIITAASIALFLLVSFGIIKTTTEEASSQMTSVAVLPFTSTGEQQEEFLLSGMTDALIEQLSTLKNLLLINQSSTQILTSGFDPTDALISEKVKDIDFFIGGTLERSNNRLNIYVELKSDLKSKVLWSKNYSEDISKVDFLWNDVAQDIAVELGITEKPLNRPLIKRLRSVNPETFELYLKGKHYLNKSTLEDWQRGIYYLEQSIEKNPADPNAYAGLAQGYITIGHGLMPPPDVFPKALAAAQRAIQLDSTNAKGWAALAHYHTYFGWDWELADYAFKKAHTLNPSMAYNHYHRAWYLALFGKMNEAIVEHKYAQQLDPFASLHTAWLAELYRWVGLYDEAYDEIAKANQMHDDDALSLFVKARVLKDQGKYEEALNVSEDAIAINPMFKFLGYPEILAAAGQTDEARTIIAEMEQLPESAFIAGCIANAYFATNDLDKGFAWLEKNKKHAWYPWIRVMTLENVRKDARFAALIKELKLPDPSPLEFDYDEFKRASQL